jgi:hypothetical protein
MRQGWDLAIVSLRIVRRRKRIALLPVVGGTFRREEILTKWK